jgi:hypothetical protein
MKTLFDQTASLHSAATSLEIDPENTLEIGGQAFFLFYTRDAERVAMQCFRRWHWIPATVLSDTRLPKTRKGMTWLATDLFLKP